MTHAKLIGMRAVLALLLAIVLAGGGAGTFALAANTERWEADRLASEAVAAAAAELTDARADALAERARLATLTSEGNELLASAKALQALNPAWADAALLAALAAAVDALAAELDGALPPGVPVVDATTVGEMTEWTGRMAAIRAEAAEIGHRRDDALRAARDAVDELTRSAVKGGPGIAAMSLPDESLRDAARAALALVADDARSGADATAAITDYTHAWTAVRDAQAAAEAAAAAAAKAAAEAAAASASSNAGSSRGAQPDLPFRPTLTFADPSNPPYLIADGEFDPACWGDAGSEWYYQFADGEVVYFFSDTRYNAVFLPTGPSWSLHVYYC